MDQWSRSLISWNYPKIYPKAEILRKSLTSNDSWFVKSTCKKNKTAETSAGASSIYMALKEVPLDRRSLTLSRFQAISVA